MTDPTGNAIRAGEAEIMALAEVAEKIAMFWPRKHAITLRSDVREDLQKQIFDALRAAACPAPAAGVIDREAVARVIDDVAEVTASMGVFEINSPQIADAILALKPTMAGEPVAWRYRRDDTWPWIITPAKPDHDGFEIEPLYAAQTTKDTAP